jgi:hypothetical protein
MFTAGSIYVFKLENLEQACAVPLIYLLGLGFWFDRDDIRTWLEATFPCDPVFQPKLVIHLVRDICTCRNGPRSLTYQQYLSPF